MSNAPVQVVVAAFNTPDKAGQVMADLKSGKKAGYIGILDAAVVVKGADGKLKITDSKRRSTKGFITGGVIGGLIGLLAGPVGWAALGGGAIGALIGKIRGAPLKSELTDIGSALTVNSSAIVAIIEHTWVPQLEAALVAEGAKVAKDALKADIAEQLNAGGNVLYTAGGDDMASGAARIAEGSDGTRVTGGVVSDSGALITDAVITHEEPADANDGAGASSAKPANS